MAKRSARLHNSEAATKVHPLFSKGEGGKKDGGKRDAGWDPLGDDHRDQSYVRKIKPRSTNQQRLLEAIADHSLTLAIGPAGTGKTYLAISAAVDALEAGKIERIVLSRPAIEAGENLGFLPGDM